MNKAKIVNWSNAVGVIAAVCLVYWVFIFLVNSVFGLKIFKQNLTEAFLMSVLGLMALMAGTLMVSLMLNITRIATSLEKLTSSLTNTALANSLMSLKQKMMVLSLIAGSFVLIATAMFAGDAYTRYEKKRILLDMAQSLVEENKNKLQQVEGFKFDESSVKRLSRQINIIAKIDSNVHGLSLLLADSVDGRPVVLAFGAQTRWDAARMAEISAAEVAAVAAEEVTQSEDHAKKVDVQKTDFIFSASQAQRVYLNEVFAGKTTESRFEANNGNYELFYPVVINKKVVVFYFNDYQRYGKFSS